MQTRHIQSFVQQVSLVFFMLLLTWTAAGTGFALAETGLSLQSINGDVEIRKAAEQAWQTVKTETLNTGDSIRTLAGGQATLVGPDGSTLRLAEKTHLTVRGLFFSRAQQKRLARFFLQHGALTVNVAQLGYTRFHVTSQTLGGLRAARVPEELVRALQPLENREFDDEAQFLEAVSAQLGGEAFDPRHKKAFLEETNTGNDIFNVETGRTSIHITGSQGQIVSAQQDIVTIWQGSFTVSLPTDGETQVLARFDRKEGIRIPLSTAGSWIRVDSHEHQVTLESNRPLEEAYALIGDTDTIVRTENHAGASPIRVVYQGNNIILEAEESGTFGVPADVEIPLQFTDAARVSFSFFPRSSFFFFTDTGCPEVNGEENCCGMYLLDPRETSSSPRTEAPIIPPAPLSQPPQGAASSPMP